MTDLAVLAEPGALDQYANAGEFVVLSCERAKEWLTKCIEHGEIEQIIELKSQAEAVRVYTTTKQLGRDAELAAAEIVRRAERGIGLAVRRGQTQGTIAKSGDIGANPGPTGGIPGDARGDHLARPADFLPRHELAGGIYPVTDGVSDEMFNGAIEEAKAEGNLSRKNVIRKVAHKKIVGAEPDVDERPIIARQMASEGHTTEQISAYLGITRGNTRAFLARHGITVPADAIVGKKRKLDSDRIVRATVEQVAGIDAYLDSIDYSALDRSQLDYWVSSLSDAIRSLTTLRNNLKKEQTQ